MSLIGSVSSLPSAFLQRMPGAGGTGATEAMPPRLDLPSGGTQQASGNFSSVFDKMIQAVDAKQDEAAAITKKVLLGESDQLHQSMISMQEAGVAFQLMVETRNKVVESYQELMRMPV